MKLHDLLLIFLILFGIFLLMALKKGKKKEEEIKKLLDSLREGLFILDWEGKITAANKQGLFFLKKEKEKLLQSSFFLIPRFSKSFSYFKWVKESKISQRMSLDGIELEFQILEDKKTIAATLLDSSKEYEQEQLGKDFVANASHELRTPITIIKGFAETIHDLPEISEEMLAGFTEKIVRNCHRMDNLVKNLLTLADLDYLPKARLQEVDLVGLIDNCSHSLLALHPEIEIESFHNEEIIMINGDPDLLELAIMNLLENGVKYSDSSPFLTITIADFNGWVELTIADKGVGIPAEDLERIFERFYTVNKAHSRRLGGAGLGLSIVKAIASKHEASISAKSILGEGTSFTLTFRAATALSR